MLIDKFQEQNVVIRCPSVQSYVLLEPKNQSINVNWRFIKKPAAKPAGIILLEARQDDKCFYINLNHRVHRVQLHLQ